VFDVDKGESNELTGELARFADVVVNDAIAAVTPVLVNWHEQRVLGRFVGRPLAVSSDGRVLRALGGQASATELGRGPLSFSRPQGPRVTTGASVK